MVSFSLADCYFHERCFRTLDALFRWNVLRFIPMTFFSFSLLQTYSAKKMESALQSYYNVMQKTDSG
jgi:hypothetical protein